MADDVWRIEESFWTGGVEVYEKGLDADCIMAFPPPAGIMKRDAILRSIERAPRWTAVEMSDRQTSFPTEGVGVLAYRARSEREGSIYEAVCTSVYILRDDRWSMVQHQQTPL